MTTLDFAPTFSLEASTLTRLCPPSSTPSQPEPRLRALAVSLLFSLTRGLRPRGASAEVKPHVADALLDATLALPRGEALRAMPAATHATILAGRQTRLFERLDDARLPVRAAAYRSAMVYGRLSAFEVLRKQDTSTNAETSRVLAIVQSPDYMTN